jgi:hypothetical protein
MASWGDLPIRLRKVNMAPKLLDTVLLFSLPASGKSETRTYMSSLTPEQCREDMCMGPTVQLDDYPYVHLMHLLDEELVARGHQRLYYQGPTRPFQEDWTWAVLIELLNEDYDNLINRRTFEPASAAQHLMDRLDAAHVKVGLHPHLGDVPYRIRMAVGEAIESEARRELDVLNATCSQDRTGMTIVIECARGGPNGSAFPITPPHGYWSAFQQLSTRILERAAVLYVWVDPAESRRKNIERGRPDGQGSILNHSVPMEVMLAHYGCDDMEWLMQQSDRPDTVKVDRLVVEGDRYKSETYYLPAARFDNRKDKTSFIRAPRDQWRAEDIAGIHQGLKSAMQTLGALSSPVAN